MRFPKAIPAIGRDALLRVLADQQVGPTVSEYVSIIAPTEGPMSQFKFSCPHCEQHLQCDEQFSGREIQCPNCHHLIHIPPIPGRTAEYNPNPARPGPPLSPPGTCRRQRPFHPSKARSGAAASAETGFILISAVQIAARRRRRRRMRRGKPLPDWRRNSRNQSFIPGRSSDQTSEWPRWRISVSPGSFSPAPGYNLA